MKLLCKSNSLHLTININKQNLFDKIRHHTMIKMMLCTLSMRPTFHSRSCYCCDVSNFVRTSHSVDTKDTHAGLLSK